MRVFVFLSFCLLGLSHSGFAQLEPEIDAQLVTVNGDFEAQWPTVIGNTYFLVTSTDMINWTYVPYVNLGTGGLLTQPFSSVSHDRKFLGVRATSVPTTSANLGDPDFDGLSNYWELNHTASDPLSWDSDSDGMGDWGEWFIGTASNDDGSTNPDNGPSGDVDSDGIDNWTEYLSSFDTDNDGIPNALDSDIDGDGSPNWLDSDMDGDGYPNDVDPDIDGDGIHNDADDDDDADWIFDVNDSDPSGPNGATHHNVIFSYSSSGDGYVELRFLGDTEVFIPTNSSGSVELSLKKKSGYYASASAPSGSGNSAQATLNIQDGPWLNVVYTVFGDLEGIGNTTGTVSDGQPGKEVRILPHELVSDLNNDGEINEDDEALAKGAFESDASAKDIELGTEFLFTNDKLSNGVGDIEDAKKPGGTVTDDDAQLIRVSLAAEEGTAEFSHPAIDKLKFYSDSACANEVTFPLNLANDVLEDLYVRAEGAFTTGANGDLVLQYTKPGAAQPVDVAKLKLNLVHVIGDAAYFMAARDYMLENNARVCVRVPKIGRSNMRIVSMRHESTEMKVVETFHRNPKWYGLPKLVTLNNDQYDLLINGNFCFFGNKAQNLWGIARGHMTPRCRGNLVTNGKKNAASSSGTPGQPLEGPTAEYISSNGAGTIDIKTGVVPVNPVQDREALGGLSSGLVEGTRNQNPWYGIAEVGEDEAKVFFTITPERGPRDAYPLADLVQRLKDSGVPDLPGGGGHIKCVAGDGGSSIAIAHRTEGDGVKTKYAGTKHRRGHYWINTYLMFKSTKPRP